MILIKMDKPIRSNKSIAEINDEAQARLVARRIENQRREQYLFGTPKIMKNPSTMPTTKSMDFIPYHKHQYHHNLHIK